MRDTGIGIPEEGIDRLFQSFTQVDASTNRCYGGTGLGLAISRRLVEMMGGAIGVKSQVGMGAMFEFTFTPAATDEAAPSPTRLSDEHFGGVEVLVAEDNGINQKVIVRILEKMGCGVELASDGASAIRCLQDKPCDLVFMDLSMPGMDGIEATKRIRAIGGPLSAVPIVALTASASTEVRAKCLAAGMNDFLGKPVEFEAVRRAVERWRRHGKAAVAVAVAESQ